MSGYLQDIFDLINKIRKDVENDGVYKYKESFYFIERKIAHLVKERSFEKSIRDKIKEIEESIDDKFDSRAFTAYLLMLHRLRNADNPIMKVGIVVFLIPVICEFLRRIK